MDLNKFTVTRLAEHLWRIVDALDVAGYLVVGGEKPVCWTPAPAWATSAAAWRPSRRSP